MGVTDQSPALRAAPYSLGAQGSPLPHGLPRPEGESRGTCLWGPEDRTTGNPKPGGEASPDPQRAARTAAGCRKHSTGRTDDTLPPDERPSETHARRPAAANRGSWACALCLAPSRCRTAPVSTGIA